MFEAKLVKVIKYLAYSLLVIIPLVYFPTGMYPFNTIKVVIFQSVVEVIFALWLALAIYDKKYRPEFSILTISVLGFMAIASLSAVFGSDWQMSLWSDESRAFGLVALFHFGALFLALSSLKDQINWKSVWTFSFATASLVSVIGILQKLVVFSKEANVWFYIIYSGIPDRIGATFNNTAFLAGYLLFNFFIGLWLVSSRTSVDKILKDFKFWLYAAGTALIFLAIFYTQTMGALLGLLFGLFILVLYFIYQKEYLNLRKIFAIVLFLSVALGGFFWLTKDNLIWQKIPGLSRVAHVSFSNSSIRDRLIVWKISLRAFEQKPLLGWGFENFRIAYNKNYDPNILTISMTGTYWDKPHNVVLEHLVDSGVLGLLAYLSIFASALYLIFKGKVRNYYVLAALAAYFAQNLFVFDTIGTYLMFFFLLAFIDSGSKTTSVNDTIKFEENNLSAGKYLPFVVSGFLLISLVPIYYNYQIFAGSINEYWGVNYLLNQFTESSLISFSEGVTRPTPYKDDIYKNFANIVKQAYQQGIYYSKLNELQGKVVDYLRIAIKDHPQDFFNYISLAEFENVFYKYNPDYLKEAESLANQALMLSPGRQQVYYVLAKTKLLEGDSVGAYKAFDEVIAVDPLAGDPHFFYGLTAYALGDVNKGRAEINEAAKLGRGPQGFEESIALGDLTGDKEHDYKKAIEFYSLALSFSQNKDLYVKKALQFKATATLKLALAYYFDNNKDKSKYYFSELSNLIDLKSLPVYHQLEPILKELKIID